MQVDRLDLVLEENPDKDACNYASRYCIFMLLTELSILWMRSVIVLFFVKHFDLAFSTCSTPTPTGSSKGSGYGFADKVRCNVVLL